MANESKDQPVLGHIDGLVKEEERLYAKGELTDDDRDRLAKIKVELDQCWDLLRQRRALREFGRDPDQAKVRPRRSSKTTSSSPGRWGVDADGNASLSCLISQSFGSQSQTKGGGVRSLCLRQTLASDKY